MVRPLKERVQIFKKRIMDNTLKYKEIAGIDEHTLKKNKDIQHKLCIFQLSDIYLKHNHV